MIRQITKGWLSISLGVFVQVWPKRRVGFLKVARFLKKLNYLKRKSRERGKSTNRPGHQP